VRRVSAGATRVRKRDAGTDTVSAGPRNPRIDTLRGVSVLLVLLHHFNIAYVLRDTALARAFGWDAVHAVVRNGNYGVTMFFVISGYLITSNARRRWGCLGAIDARTFYVSRIARIMPCLLLLLVLVNGLAAASVPIFRNHAPLGEPVSFWLVNFASLTFWMNVLIGSYGWVNYALGVLWSLSVEEVFYLSFPLLCIALRRDGRLFAFWACVVAIGPLYRATHSGDEGGFLYAYFACFDGIAIGCCTALLAERPLWRALAMRATQWLTVAGMTVLYLAWPIAQSHVLGVTGVALGTAVLLIGAHANGARRSARLWPRYAGAANSATSFICSISLCLAAFARCIRRRRCTVMRNCCCWAFIWCCRLPLAYRSRGAMRRRSIASLNGSGFAPRREFRTALAFDTATRIPISCIDGLRFICHRR
jgi:peptidoglycan/LPS O-acetylase OafA/YrhL